MAKSDGVTLTDKGFSLLIRRKMMLVGTFCNAKYAEIISHSDMIGCDPL